MRVRIIYTIGLILLVIALSGIYLFISSPIRVSKQIKVKGSAKALYALMSDRAHWKESLKKDTSAPSGFGYTPTNNSYPVIFMEAVSAGQKIPIELEIRDMGALDSAVLSWHCAIPAGSAPWTRVQRYKEAWRLKKDFSAALNQFADYAGDSRNLYGINIEETLIKNTIIATLSRLETTPPTAALRCSMTEELRRQISNDGLLITDSAMTLVQQSGENKYTIMVGFAVNKVPGAGSKLIIKKMIPGKLLTGTVYGGPSAINRGYEQMRKYIMDQNREEVASPYEIAIVNKCAVPDTGKWITKICYPVY